MAIGYVSYCHYNRLAKVCQPIGKGLPKYYEGVAKYKRERMPLEKKIV